MVLVHRFGDPVPSEGRAALGGKGLALAEMTRIGLPVPPGFTLTTELWRTLRSQGTLPPGLPELLRAELARIEAACGLRFGDPSNGLLVAVRSGAPNSMPGMLETVLDVGIDRAIARGLCTRLRDERVGHDARRRFLESYGTAVLGVPREAFDAVLKRRDLRELDAAALEALADEYEGIARRESGEAVPSDPWTQLLRSVEGVLRSWETPRARQYREAHGIGEDEGTAVTIQLMVFGNLRGDAGSGAGVVFSRNPSTGERKLYGEWLPGAQGEDVVGGRVTPHPLMREQVRRGQPDRSLESAIPRALEELRAICDRLETEFGDAQDVEFAIEAGALYPLQCRAAKRTARAAARIAVEMVDEGRLSIADALCRIDPSSLRQLLTPRVPDPQQLAERGLRPVARGLAASPGGASGRIVLDPEAVARHAAPNELVLVRAETSPEDVEAMRSVLGILTAAGGLTSHAAVVARAMGKPCVAGATSLHVDYARGLVLARTDAGTVTLAEGDPITIDGTRGLVYAAEVAVEPAAASEHVNRLLAWADEARTVRVLAEATTERMAQVGASFGADGVFVAASAHEVASLRASLGPTTLWWEPTESDAVADARDGVLAPGDVLVGPEGIPSDAILHGAPEELVEDLRRGGVQAIAVPPLEVGIARLVAAQAALGRAAAGA